MNTPYNRKTARYFFPNAGLRPASGRWCRNNCETENLVAVCLKCYENDFWGLHSGMSVSLHTVFNRYTPLVRECLLDFQQWMTADTLRVLNRRTIPDFWKRVKQMVLHSSLEGFTQQIIMTSDYVDVMGCYGGLLHVPLVLKARLSHFLTF